jgi:hypothetical protein
MRGSNKGSRYLKKNGILAKQGKFFPSEAFQNQELFLYMPGTPFQKYFHRESTFLAWDLKGCICPSVQRSQHFHQLPPGPTQPINAYHYIGFELEKLKDF